MRNLITDVPGLKVGHAADAKLGSGSTVIVFDQAAVASVDVRGGGPGTRESALLDPAQTVEGIDAIALSGGSAFGLDAASGVQAWLKEQNRGFGVGAARVPIVPGAVLFDLLSGGDKDWGTVPLEDLAQLGGLWAVEYDIERRRVLLGDALAQGGDRTIVGAGLQAFDVNSPRLGRIVGVESEDRCQHRPERFYVGGSEDSLRSAAGWRRNERPIHFTAAHHREQRPGERHRVLTRPRRIDVSEQVNARIAPQDDVRAALLDRVLDVTIPPRGRV